MYVTAKNIRRWGLDLDNVTYVTADVHREIYARCPVELGDVLYIKDGATTGIAVNNSTSEPFSLLSSVALIKPIHNVLDPRFLKHWLNSPATFRRLTGDMTGTAIKRLVLKQLRAVELPLPPLPEQVRIADKLDALLARVESGRERLERVPKLLKRFRQSVLSAAVSGELTREWRGGGDAEWEKATGHDVFSFITSGSRGWAEYYSESGSIFLRIGNLEHHNIALDLRNIQHVKPPRGAEGLRTRVQVDDILISITADVGMIAHIDHDIGEAYINQHICMARPKPENNARYLAYFLTAPNGGLAHLKNIQRGATKVGLTLGDIRGTVFQLPPLAEQAEIVRRVESLFAIADRIEAKYAAALSSFDRMTPALLAKAFRGELVPQDPNDEPASVLLERIRAAREAEGGKRGRGRPAKTAAGIGDGAEVKRRGRPPGANAQAGAEGAEPKRRGRPPKVREAVSEPAGQPAAVPEAVEASAAPRGRGRPPGVGIPQASSFEDALRQLEEQKLTRAQGARQVGLFDDAE
ncbi:restriction endonuclease subunit S [Deinococcus radiotolerans]|nr:restriction endonuclease subunit S [Deinococcus radiotolerans]